MKELSLNILDIAQNSVKAEAAHVEITVDEQPDANLLTITIADDGCGMSPQLLSRVTDPFTTTRTTRKVGLGIPLFKQAAEMTGGRFEITSEENVGTTVTASFVYDSIDRMPLGDIPSTVSMLAGSRAGTAWTYSHVFKDRSFVFSTDEIQRQIGETDFAAPEIAEFIRDYIGEQLQILYGGNSL